MSDLTLLRYLAPELPSFVTSLVVVLAWAYVAFELAREVYATARYGKPVAR